MKKFIIKGLPVLYDTATLAIFDFLLLWFWCGPEPLSVKGIGLHFGLTLVCVLTARFAGNIYRQAWYSEGIQCCIRLFFTDGAALLLNLILVTGLSLFFPAMGQISIPVLVSVFCLNLLGALAMRILCCYACQYGSSGTRRGRVLSKIFCLLTGLSVLPSAKDKEQKVRIAIVGAGRIGAALAEELINSEMSAYTPCCFLEISPKKAGMEIHGIPVLSEDERSVEKLRHYGVREVAFSNSDEVDETIRKALFEKYLQAGFKIKVYDSAGGHTAEPKRHLREFDLEELLFRKPICISDEKTRSYYRDKIVLITGGGGSIGSELCRQLAKMAPKKIIILDICENGAYDVQQDLKIAYGDSLDVCIEIGSITNRKAMTRVFEAHHPQIVINAAAHKHVPLMEHNCIEAVENNVFGTVVLVELCEKYHAERFMMVSTDKAVNPTGVMGATKRLCERIVRTASVVGKVKYSATRFGNVLGSAGSVIPLFKRQILNGGPITLTDKRVIRYFMTVSEASQLVLQSGALAENGELFVLDMGRPVRILDLAETMIRLSGAADIEIIETGLRPGEKLFEELLVKTEDFDKTENSLIFIERDTPLSQEELDEHLTMLKEACESGEDDLVRAALRKAVPTFRASEEGDGAEANFTN